MLQPREAALQGAGGNYVVHHLLLVHPAAGAAGTGLRIGALESSYKLIVYTFMIVNSYRLDIGGLLEASAPDGMGLE